jgi:hypothetical protein
MGGLLEACGVFPDEDRGPLIELGCRWSSGPVRLQALQLLAARDPERARSLAQQDPSNTIRWRADSLGPTPSGGGAPDSQLKGPAQRT